MEKRHFRGCLRHCALWKPPRGGWNILAVDNGSTDRTPDILTGYQSRLPLHRVFHPEPGKNAALNKALEQIEGELVVFTDDDVVPEKDWLRTFEKVAEARPDYDIFGGAITPDWPTSPPAWLLEDVPLGPAYGVTPPDRDEGPLRPSAVFGGNMMIRAEVFRNGIRFDDGIGPGVGAYYTMGGETDLTERLVRLGHRCWFSPDATVRHVIRPYQMKRRWVLRRAIRSGKGGGAQDLRLGRVSAATPKWLGAPRFLYRELLLTMIGPIELKRFWRSLVHDSSRIKVIQMDKQWNFFYLLGRIHFHRQRGAGS